MFINVIKICEEMHTLPHPGGLLQQDSLFVYVLHQYLVFKGQKQELDNKKSGG